MLFPCFHRILNPTLDYLRREKSNVLLLFSDPNIDQLQTIFPQINSARLRSTLASCRNDLQTAVEQLAAATCSSNVQGKIRAQQFSLTLNATFMVMIHRLN